jgi:alpha-tubulin suppressor-like RCC1 family protein
VQVVGLPVGDPVVSISSGEGTQAALTASGTLWMWGEGAHGALGDGSTANADAPMQVPGQWSAVSDGGSNSVNNHAVAITTSGVVEAWGANSFGQLGDGTLTKSSQPVSVMVPAGVSFTKVLAGGSESGAIDTNGHVWMWGGDRYGELGDGSKVGSRRTPIEVDSEKTMLSGTSRNVVDG